MTARDRECSATCTSPTLRAPCSERGEAKFERTRVLLVVCDLAVVWKRLFPAHETTMPAPLAAVDLASRAHTPASPLHNMSLKARAPLSRNLAPPERLNQRLAACVRLHELQLHELQELRLLASHAMCGRLDVLGSRSLALALSQIGEYGEYGALW